MPDEINTEQPTPPQSFDELVERTNQEEAIAFLQSSLNDFALARGRQLNGANVNPIEVLMQLAIQTEKLAALVDELEARHGVDDKRFALRIAGRLQNLAQKARNPVIAHAVGRGLKRQ